MKAVSSQWEQLYPTFHVRNPSPILTTPTARQSVLRTCGNRTIVMCQRSTDKLSGALYGDQTTGAGTLCHSTQNPRAQLPIPLSEGPGRLPGTRLPPFFGRDDENVLSWPQKIVMALEAARVPENSKFANMVPLLRSDEDSWFYSFMQSYHDRSPTFIEFKAAIIRKYESSEVRDDHLRSKLQSIKLS